MKAIFTRAEYMAGGDDQHAAHRRYYGQFVTPRERAIVKTTFGIDLLRASADPYFNDIPILLWDALIYQVGYETWAAMRDAGDPGPVSLGNSACLFKEAARQLVEAEPVDIF